MEFAHYRSAVLKFFMRKIFFLFSVVSLISVLVVYVNRDRDVKNRLFMNEDSYMDEVNIIQKNGGIIKWTLSAKKAVLLNSNDIKLFDLKITFPEKELILTSDEGIYNTEDKDLRIEGNINASTKGYKIKATNILWDSSTNELSSDKRVQIVGDRFYIEGDMLTATTDKAKLGSNVRAVFDGK